MEAEYLLEALTQLFSEFCEAYDASYYPLQDLEVYVDESAKLLESWLVISPLDAKLTRRTWAILKLALQNSRELPEVEAKEHLSREASVTLELFLQLKKG